MTDLTDLTDVTDLTVRRARPAEYADVAELTVAAYRALFELGSYEPHLRDVAGRAAESEVLVAVDGSGRLVGAVAFAAYGSSLAEQSGPGDSVFRMLAVSPESRGRGAGGALVQACIDRARSLDLDRLRLSTMPVMYDAQRLYERLGFTRTPALDWSPEPGVDLITYALELT